jgi:hypothetical protein
VFQIHRRRTRDSSVMICFSRRIVFENRVFTRKQGALTLLPSWTAGHAETAVYRVLLDQSILIDVIDAILFIQIIYDFMSL